MYLPGSTCSQGGAFSRSSSVGTTGIGAPSGPGTSRLSSAWLIVFLLLYRHHLDLPPLRGGHSGPVGVMAHDMAGWRTVRDKDHPARHLPFFTQENSLTSLGDDADTAARDDPGFLHVVGMHGH